MMTEKNEDTKKIPVAVVKTEKAKNPFANKWLYAVIAILVILIAYMAWDKRDSKDFIVDGVKGGWTQVYENYKVSPALRAALNNLGVVDEFEIQQLVAAEAAGKKFEKSLQEDTSVLNTEVFADGAKFRVFNDNLKKGTRVLLDFQGNPAIKCGCGNPIKVRVSAASRQETTPTPPQVAERQTEIEYYEEETFYEEEDVEIQETIADTIVERVKRVVHRPTPHPTPTPPRPTPTPTPRPTPTCIVDPVDQHAPSNPFTQPPQEHIATVTDTEEDEAAHQAEEVRDDQFSQPAGGTEPTNYGTPGDGNPGYSTPTATTTTPSGTVVTAPAPTTAPVTTPSTGITHRAADNPAAPN